MVSPLQAFEDSLSFTTPTNGRNRQDQDLHLSFCALPASAIQLTADFWEEKDLKCFASANKSCHAIVQEQKNRILEEINTGQTSLKSLYRKRKHKQIFGGNLEELLSLVRTWTRGEKKLKELDLRGIGGISPNYLQQIDSICQDDTDVIIEAFIKDCDQRRFSEELEAYRSFFDENRERKSLSLTVKNCTITEICGYDFISEINCLWCDSLKQVNLPQAKRGTFSMCFSLEEVALSQEAIFEILGC